MGTLAPCAFPCPTLLVWNVCEAQGQRCLAAHRSGQWQDLDLNGLQDLHVATNSPAPDFLYIAPEELLGNDISFVTTPSERFGNVHEWHKNTQRVWHFFEK